MDDFFGASSKANHALRFACANAVRATTNAPTALGDIALAAATTTRATVSPVAMVLYRLLGLKTYVDPLYPFVAPPMRAAANVAATTTRTVVGGASRGAVDLLAAMGRSPLGAPFRGAVKYCAYPERYGAHTIPKKPDVSYLRWGEKCRTSKWGEWTKCSVECGVGITARMNHCGRKEVKRCVGAKKFGCDGVCGSGAEKDCAGACRGGARADPVSGLCEPSASDKKSWSGARGGKGKGAAREETTTKKKSRARTIAGSFNLPWPLSLVAFAVLKCVGAMLSPTMFVLVVVATVTHRVVVVHVWEKEAGVDDELVTILKTAVLSVKVAWEKAAETAPWLRGVAAGVAPVAREAIARVKALLARFKAAPKAKSDDYVTASDAMGAFINMDWLKSVGAASSKLEDDGKRTGKKTKKMTKKLAKQKYREQTRRQILPAAMVRARALTALLKMSTNPTVEWSSRLRCLAALVRLSVLDPGRQAMIESMGGVDVATQVLLTWLQQRSLQGPDSAMQLIRVLLYAPASSILAAKRLAVTSGETADALARVLAATPGNVAAQRTGLASTWQILRLAGPKSGVAERLVKVVGLFAHLVDEWERSKHDEGVAQCIAGITLELALGNKKMQKILTKLGAQLLVAKVFVAHRSLDFQGRYVDLKEWMLLPNPDGIVKHYVAGGVAKEVKSSDD